jgi:hypothetical protein
MRPRATFEKRRKEQERRERKQDKEERRKQRRERRALPTDAPDGEDPDIAHIVSGPQPVEEVDEVEVK